MNRESINQMWAVWRSEHQGVQDLIQRAEDEKAQAAIELQNLEAGLPDLLADLFLGKIKKADVAKVKKQRADLKETIEDLPLVINILKCEELRHSHKARPIDRLERTLKEYEDQKAKILEKPDFRYRERWEEELLVMSRNPDLDCEPDAQKFLADLKNGEVKS